MPELRHVDVDGVRVAYVEAGTGEPVVLIHGYPESHEAWRHQLPELAATHRVIAVDWFGWGQSEKSTALDTTYDREVGRLAKLLETLDAKRCTLVVHDYAGYLALGYVVAYPDRVARLAILNSRGHETFPRSGFWATWGAKAGAIVAPSLLAKFPLERIHRFGLDAYRQAGCFDVAQEDRYVGWLVEPANRRWFAKFMQGYSLRARRELLPALAQLAIPTAIIWGDADPWCPNDIAQELAATIPGATLTMIDHGNHFVMEHKPAEVTAALRALLDRPAGESKTPIPVGAPAPRRASNHYRGAILAGWSWTVCAGLVLLGLIGLFTEQLGPVHTNQAHALALNLSVGLFGFAFARFALEPLFVLASGIGMVVVSVVGFMPSTQDWWYKTFNLNATSSWVELASGIISLVLWVAFRPRP